MKKKSITVVCASLLDEDNNILICKRPKNKTFEGFWEFPGGKVEINESLEQSLIRELNEELGIKVNKRCLAPFTFSTHCYKDFDLLILLYICRVWDGHPYSKEYQEICWVSLNQIRNFKMPEANKSLVGMLIDYL